MPREALNAKASKPGVIGVASSKLKALARAITSWGSEISAGSDLVHHFGGRVAQHTLRAYVEKLNYAFFVGGDTREVGAVENGVLQRSRLEERGRPSNLRNLLSALEAAVVISSMAGSSNLPWA